MPIKSEHMPKKLREPNISASNHDGHAHGKKDKKERKPQKCELRER
jgi:hypothetical protein